MSGSWRPLALVVAVIMTCGGAGMLLGGAGPGLLIVGAVALVALLLERPYRTPGAPPVEERWKATGERFNDPETGAATRVWYDPATGERRYVAEPGREP